MDVPVVPDPVSLRPDGSFWRSRRDNLRRLERAVQETLARASGIPAADRGEEHERAIEQLLLANQRDLDADLRWDAVQRAWRHIVAASKGEVYQARAAAILAEAEEKLKGWRLAAWGRTFPSPPNVPEEGAGAGPRLVATMMELLDARHQNVYASMRARRYQIILTGVLVATVLAVVTGLACENPVMSDEAGAPTVWLGVALFTAGVLGALVSIARSLLAAGPRVALPEHVTLTSVTVLRTLVGGLAGLISGLTIYLRVVSIGEMKAGVWNVLFLALAAGSAEHFILPMLPAEGESGAKKSAAPGG